MAERLCAWCEKPLVQRLNESPVDWYKRRACSRSCAASLRNVARYEKRARSWAREAEIAPVRLGSLFSGYGGLDLAIEEFFGARTEWLSEFEKAPSAILEARWPGVPNLGDVTKVDWSKVPPVEILAGGFPCQDLSLAGRRAGMRSGTRSGLWSDFLAAIRALEPEVVIVENVRGLLSGCAESDLGPCEGCVGDGEHRPPLRALGRVLGDLADLGFDAEWGGLLASDVGAPHGRFRVFVVAYRRGSLGRLYAAAADARRLRLGAGGGDASGGSSGGRASAGLAGRGGVPGVVMPTPSAADAVGGRLNTPGGQVTLPGEMWDLFRTPAAAEAEGGPRDPDRPTATMRLTDQVREEQGRGLLLPTPSTMEDLPAREGEARARQLRRGKDAPSARTTTGNLREDILDVLPTPRAVRGGSSTETMYGLGAQRDDEGDAQGNVTFLPTPVAADAKSHGGSRAKDVTLTDVVLGRRGQVYGMAEPLFPTPTTDPETGNGHARNLGAESRIRWGKYEGAVRRWERVTRPAPAPTLPDGREGRHRLSAAFTEWMMGLPAGWVTDPSIGLTRREALRACGNGVVPQQAFAALSVLWARVVKEEGR